MSTPSQPRLRALTLAIGLALGSTAAMAGEDYDKSKDQYRETQAQTQQSERQDQYGTQNERYGEQQERGMDQRDQQRAQQGQMGQGQQQGQQQGRMGQDQQQGQQAQTADQRQRSQQNKTTLAKLTQERDDLKTFQKAIETSGLGDALTGEAYTIFAPTDQAFSQLGDDQVQQLLRPENRQQLIALLRGHIVADEVDEQMAKRINQARTVDGDTVELKQQDGQLTVGDAKVVEPNLTEGKLHVFVIDGVLAKDALQQGQQQRQAQQRQDQQRQDQQQRQQQRDFGEERMDEEEEAEE